MVKKGIFARIEQELYYWAKNVSLYRDVSFGQVIEDALRTYRASMPATYTNIMILQKSTKKKIDFLTQYLRDPEKAQPQYTRVEIEKLIRDLLQVGDERTVKKYFKSLVALKVLDFHQYNPEIVINKVYPLQPKESGNLSSQEAKMLLETGSQNESG